MNITLRLQFDPDLPLFVAKVRGHAVEIYFAGHKNNKMWIVFIDADSFKYPTLHGAFVGAEQICRTRFGVDFEFYFPTEDT